jgi:histidinol-phosphate aminotransferase
MSKVQKSLVAPNIRRLKAYVPGEQPKISGLIKLNTNENPYPPSPRVLRTLRSALDSRLRLYPDPSCVSLRRKIARRFGCSVENVFIGNGSDEILSLALRAFAGEKRRVGFPSPSYSLYPVLVQIQNARPRVVEFGGGYELPVKAFSRDAALTFVAHPNAPSGTPIPRSTLARLARRLRGVLLIDEAYADFARDNHAALFKRHPNVLVTRSFSKSYSLAGMRVGFALGSRPLIEALLKVKDSYNVDRLAQLAAEAAFGDQAYLRKTVRRIQKTRQRLESGLRKLGWEALPSAANFVFARPPHTPAAKVFRHLRQKKVLVRHFPGNQTGGWLRITVGTDKEIDFLLRALRTVSD